MGSEPGQDGTKPEIRMLLTAADYFLQRRNFADCWKYAARARDSDPTNPEPNRILSTAAVLSAARISSTQHDYYAILNLPHFDSDASRVGSSFEALASILDPNTNPCPFSSEAFDLLVKAWSVLSNPAEKEKFDGELRRYMDGSMSASGGGGSGGGGGGGTFWTMCPYCYYVYEYDRVFEDCCLKCANAMCRRVLHAVAIGGPPPPPDVVEKGEYCCPGFMPFAIRGGDGDEIGEKSWIPFAPAHNLGKGLDLNNSASITLFDDEKPVEIAVKPAKFRMQRKKSVPWKSKKLMGRGVRIDENQANFAYRAEEDEAEHQFSGEAADGIHGGVEFLEGDDDVFISLPCDFEMENGGPMSL